MVLPWEYAFARGRVIGWKQDADGNPIGRANASPILNTRCYEVQFPDGEVTELMANAITESMYAQCDQDGNNAMIFYQMVDFQKNKSALRIE